MKTDYQTFINKWLEAWSNKSTNDLLKFYDEDAIYLDPYTKKAITSRQKMKNYFTAIFKSFQEWEWKSLEVLETYTGCVVKWKAIFLINSDKIEIIGLDIVDIKSSKITRNEVYFDRSKLINRQA